MESTFGIYFILFEINKIIIEDYILHNILYTAVNI
jgi:hypothetical protein